MRADWHPEDVKAAVRKTGWSLARLAERWGYSPNGFRVVLRRPWPAAEAVIARHLQLPPTIIWPSRYDGAGRSLTRRYTARPKDGAGETSTHRKSGGPA